MDSSEFFANEPDGFFDARLYQKFGSEERMSFKINSYISSLHVASALQKTQKAIARSLERLSTAQAVNSPRDDAHAYSLGVGLTSQIRGLAQVNTGVNTALGMVDTASSAVSNQIDIVQRMKEIALQSSNGTLANTDRANLNLEFQSLLSEYNRITDTTNFNGTKLLDGSFSTLSIQTGTRNGDSYGINMGSTQASQVLALNTKYTPVSADTNTLTLSAGSAINIAQTGAFSIGVTDGATINSNFGSGAYFTLSSADGNNYTVWYNIDGLGNDPGNDFETEVDISSSDDANTVASKTADALVASGFTASSTDSNVSLTDLQAGADSISDNGTAFSFTTTAEGQAAGKLTISDSNGSLNDLIWFNVDGRGGNPGIGTIEVDVNSTDSATAVAQKLNLTLLANGFNVATSGNQETITSPTGHIYTVQNSGMGTGFNIAYSGVYQARTTVAVGNFPWINITTADLNGDGKTDLVTTDLSDNTLSVLLGNGDGTFKTRTTFRTGVGPSFSTAIDVNGDGKLDILTLDSTDGTISVFLGNGNGTFSARTTLRTGSGPASLATGDINGDGKIDIVSTDYNNGTVSVFLGNGNGIFAARSTLNFGTSGATSVILTDTNGDGKLDVVATNQVEHSISVALGNGNGTFQARTSFSVGDIPPMVAAGDVNGDGKIDLVEADFNHQTVTVRLGNGNGTFKAGTALSTGGSPQTVTLLDINGDGKLDILSPNILSGNIDVFLGNGNGTFSGPAVLASGSIPFYVTAADVNGDGIPDIIGGDRADGTLSIRLANSIAPTSFSVTTQANAEALLQVFDNAIANLSGTRAKLEGLHSRLDETAASNLLLSENLQDAKSKAIDSDFALETANLVRNQILEQAQVAVLAQANLSQQLVLKLLDFIKI
ncbi:MAG: flagellin protein FlaA [Bacteriovoracaceae bacterium]|nr:flagellin protein FlaA [Bacteriovoracaceae bacterium]